MCFMVQKICNATPETISHHYVFATFRSGSLFYALQSCDTVRFQRFMHLKACNGYGLNATYQSILLSTCFCLIRRKVFKYKFQSLGRPKIDKYLSILGV